MSPTERGAEAIPDGAYPDALEHLEDELTWVRLRVHRLVVAKRKRGELDSKGLAVSPTEVQSYFEQPGGGASDPPSPEPADPNQPSEETLLGWSRDVRARIQERERLTLSLPGRRLPLVDLKERFGLSEEDADILRILMAIELEPRFERIYSYAWNDFTRKRPTLGFLLELLGPGLREVERYRRRLVASSPLRSSGLIHISPPDTTERLSFLARTVVLAPRVVDFLRGQEEPDEAVRRFGQLAEPSEELGALVLPPTVIEAARQTIGLPREAGEGEGSGREIPPGIRALLLWGRQGTGKRSLVRAVARQAGRKLWYIDLGALFGEPQQLPGRLAVLMREARLADAVVLWDASTDVPSEDVPWSLAAALATALRTSPQPVFVCAPHRLPWLLKASQELWEVPVPLPTSAQRAQVLRAALAQLGPAEDDVDPDDLAGRFGLPGGTLMRAASKARERADLREAGAALTSEELRQACQAELAHRLSSLADEIHSTFTWEDVILPEETLKPLREMVAFARNRRFLMERWGFRQLVPYGSGLTVLFSGPPGTGKTMVAGILARDLGMDLFRVDLSKIVDKYVGETEKNLGKVFDEAEQSHAILLFDEADSLFGQRTATYSSVDRYANLEVNFLLQRMENFDGVTILTTNLDRNLDDAFKRRLKFHIAFPFPDEDARVELWDAMLPVEAELDEDVDLEDLADYELCGGHIKNAVLRAASQAADEGRPISMADLHYAAGQETQSLGKLTRD